MSICISCGKNGEFICFCSEAILCKGCIGHHLTEEPIMKHKPVSLRNNEITNIIAKSWSKLEATTQDILDKTKEEILFRQAIENKLSQELRDLDSFQRLADQFAIELVKSIGNQLEKCCLTLKEKVNSTVSSIRNELNSAFEDLEGQRYDNPILSQLRSCEDLSSFKLLNKEIDFEEINLNSILSEAFKFDISLNEPEKPVLIVEEKPAPKRLSRSIGSSPKIQRPPKYKTPTKLLNDRLTQPTRKPYLYYFDYTAKKAAKFDPLSCDLHPLPLPKQEIGTKGSSWTNYQDTVFITGGVLKIAKNTLWKLDCSNNQYHLCANMRQPRSFHASVVHSDFLYVLGGFDKGPLQECERYYIPHKKWQRVGNLKIPRYKHSAIALNGRIFVAGGKNEDSFEAYNPVTNTFNILRLTLPLLSKTIMVPNHENAIVLCNGHSLAFDPKTLTLAECSRIEFKGYWTPVTPVISGKNGFFMVKKSVFKVNLTNGYIDLVKSI